MVASKEDDGLFSRLISSQLSRFTIRFTVPRCKIPKWFSCQMDFMRHRRFEFWIVALPNFKWDNNTGLALYVAVDRQHRCCFELMIHINEMRVLHSRGEAYYVGSRESDHVWVRYIPFTELWPRGYMRPLPPFTCRVVLLLERHKTDRFKSCGVHLIVPPNEKVCMKLIRAENRTSEPSDDDDQVDSDEEKDLVDNWEKYHPKHRADCKELLYTDALQQNQEQ
ncbi:PREDICTED: uncharacterized protein LOC101297106 [Fragaria vesca subsp. vesca]